MFNQSKCRSVTSQFWKRVNREIFQDTLTSKLRLEGERGEEGTIWMREALAACEAV